MTMSTATPPGMGRCEVTGKIVPEDELIVLNGQRVCGEGKALLLERLKAGEALPGEAERPTVLRRFGCIFLDGLILAVPSFLFSFLFALGAGATRAGGASLALVGIGQLIAITIGILYFTFLHGSRGQTVGKMAGKLKVIRLDGKPMTIGVGFIRALAYQGPSLLPPLFLIIAAMLPAGFVLLSAVGNLIVGVYGITNVVFALADRSQQRALHDRIAGTRVITIGR